MTKQRRYLRAGSAFTLGILALLLAACGVEATTPEPPALGADASAEEILARARDAMAEVFSYRATLDLGDEQDEAHGEILERTLEWAAPDTWVLSVNGEETGFVAGGRVFYRRFGEPDSEWAGGGPVDEYPGFIPYPPFLRLDDARRLDDTSIADVRAHVVEGKTRSSDPGTRFGVVFNVELAVSTTDFRVLRMIIRDVYRRVAASEPGGTPEPLPTTPTDAITFSYYDFNQPVALDPPEVAGNGCADSRFDPQRLLGCGRFSQTVYWLGQRLAVEGAPDLVLFNSSRSDGEGPISPSTRLVTNYREADSGAPGSGVELHQWHRPAWEEYIGQFTGYDPANLPPGGAENWWQHPCVEREVYRSDNGATVHLFEAHLVSLIYLFPMTPEQVAGCLGEPVGAVGAHVYFEDTVVAFSIAHQVIPSSLQGPVVVEPDATAAPPSYPALILRQENVYNGVSIARQIADSLRQYERSE